MKKKTIYEINSLYRDNFRVTGYEFGNGKKSVCVVGSIRGNEIQQLYTCSQLIRRLKRMEAEGKLIKGHKILVIPSINPYSMNIKKRFWPTDNTDINRMFPGYHLGETTQRIAAGVFEAIKDYEYGMQFASFYMPGEFTPHVRMMKAGYESVELARKFGMPYVVLRNTRPYDTTTLNYNWQIWETKAFSLYTTSTQQINKSSAARGVASVLTFLDSIGAVRYRRHEGYVSQVIGDDDLICVRSPEAGLFESEVTVEQEVKAGMVLARILNPVDGEEIAQIYAPCDGIVCFLHNEPLTYGHTAVIKLVKI